MLIRGKAKWPKITGLPVPGFDKSQREWTVDVYVDAETAKFLKKEGFNLKETEDGTYVRFKRREFNKEGKPNNPITIEDNRGNVVQKGLPGSDGYVKYTGPQIGNDTVVNVRFDKYEYAKGKFSTVILALQIWDLVEYKGQENFPTKEEDGSWEEDAA